MKITSQTSNWLNRRTILSIAGVLVLLTLWVPGATAQRGRLTAPIQSRRRVQMHGHMRPQAIAENDQGPVDPTRVLSGVTLVLRPSADQQTALNQLLKDQQNPASPDYHHWLTPEQFADRFGTSPDDLAKIADWLKQQNLEVVGFARGRNAVTFRGTAQTVGQALGTQFRRYAVGSKSHFANATEPTLPSDLEPLVTAIQGLDDFGLEARYREMPQAAPTPEATSNALNSKYTSSSGNHYLAPDDFAAIFNLNPLYAVGIDGTGQTIVVAGQTQLDLTSVRMFRSKFGLPANDPQLLLVPGFPNPGVSSGDVPEANLDLEWTGAIARNAQIIYVYSYGVLDAVHYAIDQNLAPVISVSYGLCEGLTPNSAMLSMQSWAQQGNAQGITWVDASGDAGAADCFTGTSNSGLAVDVPASIPEVTAIGGTTLAEGTGTFWSSTNSSTSASALSYIPETTWNDSTINSASASGGGPSSFFLKPAWQTGPGVINDGFRSVPDISFPASPQHDGYLVYSGGVQVVYGGTSVGTPIFSGVVALLNHYQARTGAPQGLGNMNPRLYSLAQTAPNAFHDVTTGNNTITIACTSRSRNCTSGSYGYSAGPGYDFATGLGSLDVYNFMNAWMGSNLNLTHSTATITLSAASSSLAAADTTLLTATVSGTSGKAPQGTITFRVGGASLGTVPLVTPSGNTTSTATLTLSGTSLSAGMNSISASYSGDSVYATASASTQATLTTSQTGPPMITALANAASFKTNYAPGMLLTVFGAQLSPITWIASSVPLPNQVGGVSVTINGVSAPLLYISPTQLNIQVPYELAPFSAATLIVNNNGISAIRNFIASTAAPGIFTNPDFAPVPFPTAARGQTVTLYITGAGAVTPQLLTGAAPSAGTSVSALPHAVSALTVTVGGIDAPVAFSGIGPGLVGVVQVNYQVPLNAPLGINPVIVSISTQSSAPASLTVTP
ncbi:MAG: protease pro-enzyme activation domain-containing protein [Acidobacteriota bacterium]